MTKEQIEREIAEALEDAVHEYEATHNDDGNIDEDGS